jgi:chromosome segregation ATPase
MRSVQDAQKSELEERSLKMRKWESEMAQRESDLKVHRLELDKEAAILGQKLDFLRQECVDKEERLGRLQAENISYSSLFEEKDSEIAALASAIEEQRTQFEA